MILNEYEHTLIKNEELPKQWQHQNELDDLYDFLQQNWEQRSVFYDDNITKSKQQFLDFTGKKAIRTKNYIGTIAFNGSQLNVFPKMFKEDKDYHEKSKLSQEHLLNNLVHWISYCNKVEYPFINISTEFQDANNLKEFFITLYIRYVHNALNRGLFYQYVNEGNDIKIIKGKFDVKDYLIKKIPNGRYDLFKCSYDKFEFDNKVNRIIKYTIKLLYEQTNTRNRNVLRKIMTKLEDVTYEVCKPADCDSIRLNALNKNYRIIISMSKMFLLNQTPNLKSGLNDNFCFLFPTELLFEGFVGGFFQEVVSDIGGKVHLQQSDMKLIDNIIYNNKSLGPAFTMRHDIVVEINDKVFILDAKYKQVARFEGDEENVKEVISNEPKQTDIYQLCEYARKRCLKDVYLLYPMYRFEEKEPTFPIGVSDDNNGGICVHFVRLPFIFEENENSIYEMLKEIIIDICA